MAIAMRPAPARTAPDTEKAGGAKIAAKVPTIRNNHGKRAIDGLSMAPILPYPATA